VDPFGLDVVQVLPASIDQLSARSADHALAIADGQLWEIRGQWPVALPWPEGSGAPRQLCGDPSSDANGFVVADGLLHRDHGQWWEWTRPGDEPWADADWLASSAGACLGTDGELWLADERGQGWRISVDYAQRVEALDGADAAVLLGGTVAARRDGELLTGDDARSRVIFEAGEVGELSAGGDTLWVAAGDRLYRGPSYDGQAGAFETVTIDGEPVVPGLLRAEPGGGVWTVDADRACYLREAPPVRVRGVHHLERISTETVEIVVQPITGSLVHEARLDGETLPLSADAGQWHAEPQALEPGWHALEIDTETHTRSLVFEQRRVGDLTWTGDIEPLFEAHCSGAACHGPGLADGSRPDLSSWDAWVEREESILRRVVNQGDMPPVGARQDDWGLETTLMISEWFEAGAAAGEEQ
ncbi:MAG: hypothetical protein AB1Z98_08435, partial [Nannocystaceae bacterium]